MPIRVHVSQLSDEALLDKFGVKKRAKPRELERQRQVALIKWVRSAQGAYPVLNLLYAWHKGHPEAVKKKAAPEAADH